MPGRSPSVMVTVEQQKMLELLSQASSEAQSLRQRAQIILLAFDRKQNAEIAQMVRLHRNHVGLWRKRWIASFERLVEVECRGDQEALRQLITRVLSDLPRSGRPVSKRVPTSAATSPAN